MNEKVKKVLHWTMTGRSRPRIGLWGRLIIQVEEKRNDDEAARWRDATAQDLLPITGKERSFG